MHVLEDVNSKAIPLLKHCYSGYKRIRLTGSMRHVLTRQVISYNCSLLIGL